MARVAPTGAPTSLSRERRGPCHARWPRTAAAWRLPGLTLRSGVGYAYVCLCCGVAISISISCYSSGIRGEGVDRAARGRLCRGRADPRPDGTCLGLSVGSRPGCVCFGVLRGLSAVILPDLWSPVHMPGASLFAFDLRGCIGVWVSLWPLADVVACDGACPLASL